MQQYYLVPIVRKECQKKFDHSSKEVEQLKDIINPYNCLLKNAIF